ncbi:MAG TPA: AMP-binding protein [Blastocatellia bacterium]|nr:AMP-binding protein [Blastocatellia bacterium]
MDDPTPHLERFISYDQAIREFQWQIPQRINIGAAICGRHRDSITRIALSDVRIGGVNTYTFGALDYLSDKFATALSKNNINPGDSVAVALRPSAALAVALLGILKIGGVVVPLSPTSTPDFVEYVLQASDPKVLVLDESLFLHFPVTKSRVHTDGTIFVVRDLRPTAGVPYKDFWSEVDRCSSEFTSAETESDSPVFIFFIETKGEVSGIVHSVRSVICQLAGFEFSNEFDDNAVFWVGDDWSSAASVLSTLYPAWWYGCSIVANSFERQIPMVRLVNQSEVTNVFLRLKATQGRDELSTVVTSTSLNEILGTPETGWIIGNSRKWVESPFGSTYRVVPGRLVEVIDDGGNALPPGIVGKIAIHKSDPGLFTAYYGEVADVSLGDWFLIGMSGYKTEGSALRVVAESDRLQHI